MSKKGAEEPYKSGGQWYLEGKPLNCRSCIYYTKSSEVVGGAYCRYHNFKFKNDLSPGSDYSQCEHFSYNGYSGSGGGIGSIIGFIIFAYLIWLLFFPK